jgi:hypothetical protein
VADHPYWPHGVAGHHILRHGSGFNWPPPKGQIFFFIFIFDLALGVADSPPTGHSLRVNFFFFFFFFVIFDLALRVADSPPTAIGGGLATPKAKQWPLGVVRPPQRTKSNQKQKLYIYIYIYFLFLFLKSKLLLFFIIFKVGHVSS